MEKHGDLFSDDEAALDTDSDIDQIDNSELKEFLTASFKPPELIRTRKS